MNKIKKANFKFNLGAEVKDIITGFKGIIIARSQWLNQCNTYGLKSQKLKDGTPQAAEYFDEPQLELIKKKVVKPSRNTGGPERKMVQPNRL